MGGGRSFEFDDMQALLRFGHGHLADSAFLLLRVRDAGAARRWLAAAPVTTAEMRATLPERALQIAFSAPGLRALGAQAALVEAFSDEFVVGMSTDASRSRRLGDVDADAPGHWEWGGDPDALPHALLLLYARRGALGAARAEVLDAAFDAAFAVERELPVGPLERHEPFGFTDGISQPTVDWERRQRVDTHARERYSNLLAPGEVVLGHPNEYGEYTARPLTDPALDPRAQLLAPAEDHPERRDFGRNGSYLVLRQLGQDVVGFWRFVDRAAGGDAAARERLAAAMVGRERDGTPLATRPADGAAPVPPIPGIPPARRDDHFTFDDDPDGHRCPVGAHLRRANPRTGDFPPGTDTPARRLLRTLGFARRRADDDLVASTRFHRLLRRGRGYGPRLEPADALADDAPADAPRGLEFVCLVANLARQFEFVQNAWIESDHFAGRRHERDPLLGSRAPRTDDSPTDAFERPRPDGPRRRLAGLPRFVSVRGGGYFFLPGIRALAYLAAEPGDADIAAGISDGVANRPPARAALSVHAARGDAAEVETATERRETSA